MTNPLEIEDGVAGGVATRSDEPSDGPVDAGRGVILTALVGELGETTDEPVPYERVVQRARLEFDMDRATVEETVECLVADGVVRKRGADRLVVD